MCIRGSRTRRKIEIDTKEIEVVDCTSRVQDLQHRWKENTIYSDIETFLLIFYSILPRTLNDTMTWSFEYSWNLTVLYVDNSIVILFWLRILSVICKKEVSILFYFARYILVFLLISYNSKNLTEDMSVDLTSKYLRSSCKNVKKMSQECENVPIMMVSNIVLMGRWKMMRTNQQISRWFPSTWLSKPM